MDRKNQIKTFLDTLWCEEQDYKKSRIPRQEYYWYYPPQRLASYIYEGNKACYNLCEDNWKKERNFKQTTNAVDFWEKIIEEYRLHEKQNAHKKTAKPKVYLKKFLIKIVNMDKEEQEKECNKLIDSIKNRDIGYDKLFTDFNNKKKWPDTNEKELFYASELHYFLEEILNRPIENVLKEQEAEWTERLTRTIIYGALSFGDFFSFNQLQHIPEHAILPQEFETGEFGYRHKKFLKELIETESHIQIRTIENIRNYLEKIGSHKSSMVSLDVARVNKSFNPSDKFIPPGSISDKIVQGVFQIVRQYCEFLWMFPNTKNSVTELRCFFEDEEKQKIIQDNIELFLKCIWKTELALDILPAYLTIYMTENRSNLCKSFVEEKNGGDTCSEDKKTGEKNYFCEISNIFEWKSFDGNTRECNIYSESSPNIKCPLEFKIIMYQLLCLFFDTIEQKRDVKLYSREHSEAVMELDIKVCGMCYFNVTTEQMLDITQGKKLFFFENFTPTEMWIHPLLQEVSERLKSQFYFLPTRMPKIVRDKGYSPDKDITNRVNQEINHEFYENYKEIIFLSEGGVSARELSEKKQQEFIELFGKLVKKICVHLSDDSVEIEISDENLGRLYQVQQAMHEICAERIREEYYKKIMLFFGKYLYSPHFSKVKNVFSCMAECKIDQEEVCPLVGVHPEFYAQRAQRLNDYFMVDRDLLTEEKMAKEQWEELSMRIQIEWLDFYQEELADLLRDLEDDDEEDIF